MNIPKSLTGIGNQNFLQGAKDIIVDEDNPVYKDISGVLCTKDGQLVLYPEERTAVSYLVPEGITSFGPAAFQNYNLKKLTLGPDVETLGEYALFHTGLDKLVINNYNLQVGYNSIKTCKNLIAHAGSPAAAAAAEAGCPVEELPACASHVPGGTASVTKQATMEEDGMMTDHCKVCNAPSETVIPKVASVEMTKDEFEYTGSPVEWEVVVKDADGKIYK